MIAISDSGGGVYNPNGIDIPCGDRAQAGARHAQGPRAASSRSRTTSCSLLDCDMLAPCGLEQVITEQNADKVKAKIVCEGANGPTTPAADEILEDKGILVLPDVLANAGGVVVSYFEWVQGLQEYFWKEDEVNAKLKEIVDKAFEETWHVHKSRDLEHAAGRLRARGRARRRGDDDAGSLSRRRAASVARLTTPTAATSASVRAARSQRFAREHDFELER